MSEDFDAIRSQPAPSELARMQLAMIDKQEQSLMEAHRLLAELKAEEKLLALPAPEDKEEDTVEKEDDKQLDYEFEKQKVALE